LFGHDYTPLVSSTDEILGELLTETVNVTSIDEVVEALNGNSLVHGFLLKGLCLSNRL